MTLPTFFHSRLSFPALSLCAVLAMAVLASCSSKDDNYEACTLQASRESKTDRQFRTMVEACKRKYPDQ
jgi:hypothetical protein